MLIVVVVLAEALLAALEIVIPARDKKKNVINGDSPTQRMMRSESFCASHHPRGAFGVYAKWIRRRFALFFGARLAVTSFASF